MKKKGYTSQYGRKKEYSYRRTCLNPILFQGRQGFLVIKSFFKATGVMYEHFLNFLHAKILIKSAQNSHRKIPEVLLLMKEGAQPLPALL